MTIYFSLINLASFVFFLFASFLLSPQFWLTRFFFLKKRTATHSKRQQVTQSQRDTTDNQIKLPRWPKLFFLIKISSKIFPSSCETKYRIEYNCPVPNPRNKSNLNIKSSKGRSKLKFWPNQTKEKAPLLGKRGIK